MKKILSMILSLTIILSLFAGVNISSSAASANDLAYEIKNGEVTITECDENASGELVIPSEIDGYPVTAIGVGAFVGCFALEKITIPGSVIRIGYGAFLGCNSLLDVTMHNGVMIIEDYAFSSCNCLNMVAIPDSVTTIGAEAFDDCIRLHDFYYSGSRGAWNRILIDSNNKCLNDANIIFNYQITEITPYITMSATEAVLGESVTVTVSGVNVSGLASADLSFYYDADCLEYENIEFIDGFDSLVSIGGCPENGEVTASFFWKKTATTDWTIELTFKTLKKGIAKISTIVWTWGGIIKCPVCNPLSVNILSEHNHNYAEIKKEPTCTEEGEITYTCSICGDSYTETIPVIEHDYGS